MHDFLSKNLYFTFCLFSFIGGISTYLYFYNREALSLSGATSDTVVSLESNESEGDKNIVVDISGAIENPGVFTLKSGSRLADLISIAGSITSEVSQKWLSRNLNLSSVLSDQQKIYIPFEWEVISSFPEYELEELTLEATVPDPSNSNVENSSISEVGETSSTENITDVPLEGEIEGETKLINLNLATQKELEELPKVGEVTAKKIIDSRPYTGIEDLQQKTGISNSIIEEIKELISF